MLIRVFFLLAFSLSSLLSFGQLRTVNQQLIWLGLGVRGHITDNLALQVSAEERRFIFPEARQQRVLMDAEVQYSFANNFKLTGGLWLFEISEPQYRNRKYIGEVKEVRPYAVVSKDWSLNNDHRLGLALKSEYRIFRPVENEELFTGSVLRKDWRERFKISYTWPLNSKAALIFAEELHLTVASSEANSDLFQQNRLMGFYQRDIIKNLTGKMGMVYWFQPTGNKDEYFSRAIFSFSLLYQFSFS